MFVRARTGHVLITILIALQIADVLSTQAALSRPGVFEANPLMAWCQIHLGAVWWLPKVGLAVLLVCTASRITMVWPYTALCVCYGLVVAGNVGLLW